MRKPDYCREEVYSAPPCGYTRCLWCTAKDMPLRCAKLNEIEPTNNEDEPDYDKETERALLDELLTLIEK